MIHDVEVHQFMPDEECLYAEASSLGFAVGVWPEHIRVHDAAGREADSKKSGAAAPSGFAYTLVGYSVPNALLVEPRELAPLWLPRRMVIWND